nr:unnamed protein product [Digitaria exilis]
MDWALRATAPTIPACSTAGSTPASAPHNWTAVPHCGASPSRLRLINIHTGAIIAEVEHSELSTHRCFGVVDGLLVLCDDDEATNHAVRLLNPLAGALARFPAITDVRDTRPTTAAVLNAFSWGPLTREEMRAVIMSTPKVEVPGDPSAINGAAIDDSTSPPTLQEPLHNVNGEIDFHTLLSFRGHHCYVSTWHGDCGARL